MVVFYRKRGLSKWEGALLVAILFALALVASLGAQVQVPDYDICKDIEPYSWWWFFYACFLP